MTETSIHIQALEPETATIRVAFERGEQHPQVPRFPGATR